jgi:hypothetical protein
MPIQRAESCCEDMIFYRHRVVDEGDDLMWLQKPMHCNLP